MSRATHIEAMPMPVIYVQHLAREFPDLDRLLAGTGLRADDLAEPDRTLTVGEDLRCVSNAMTMAKTPSWYHGWALRMAEHYHGAFGTAWRHAPDLATGLDAFQRFFPRRIPYMEIRAYATGSHYAVELRPLLDTGPLLPLLIEVPLLILQQYVASFMNRPVTDAVVELSYPAPPHADAYARAFDCPIHFDCGIDRLQLPAAWLTTRNLAYDESSWRKALAECERWELTNASRDVVGAVRRELFAALDGDAETDDPLPDLAAVARTLNLSTRTLTRRLQQLGTSYSRELDDVRRLCARKHIVDGLRVGTVAERLRYGDAASFTKAFRRWFGVPPRKYVADIRDARHP